LGNLPPALAKFQIPVAELTSWEKAGRKGNTLRNWVVEYLSVRPLQSYDAIVDALKLANIQTFWDTIEPNKSSKTQLLKDFNALIKRRNQISHEGDRETSRRSGKSLRSIDRDEVVSHIKFVEDLVSKAETAFPN